MWGSGLGTPSSPAGLGTSPWGHPASRGLVGSAPWRPGCGFPAFGPGKGQRAERAARGRRPRPRAALSRAGCCPRSPPRPSPGGLRYSDEDICNKYNGAVLSEGVNLKEKSLDASESEVSACAPSRAPRSLRVPRVTVHTADRQGRFRKHQARTRSPP